MAYLQDCLPVKPESIQKGILKATNKCSYTGEEGHIEIISVLVDGNLILKRSFHKAFSTQRNFSANRQCKE